MGKQGLPRSGGRSSVNILAFSRTLKTAPSKTALTVKKIGLTKIEDQTKFHLVPDWIKVNCPF